MNPRRDGDRAALRFRCARVCRLRRLARDGPPLPRALRRARTSAARSRCCARSPTPSTSATQGPVWQLDGQDRLMADPVSWLLIEPGWEVVDANGERIGKVDEVLGEPRGRHLGRPDRRRQVRAGRAGRVDRRGPHHTRALNDALALAAQVRAGDVSARELVERRDRARRGDEPRAELPRHRLLRAGARDHARGRPVHRRADAGQGPDGDRRRAHDVLVARVRATTCRRPTRRSCGG